LKNKEKETFFHPVDTPAKNLPRQARNTQKYFRMQIASCMTMAILSVCLFHVVSACPTIVWSGVSRERNSVKQTKKRPDLLKGPGRLDNLR
jgi:hypothetical protein